MIRASVILICIGIYVLFVLALCKAGNKGDGQK